MRLVSLIASRVRSVAVYRYLLVAGVALLLAPSSWAQSMPASDAALEAEYQAAAQAATPAATQPAAQPALPAASAASTPVVVNAASDPGWQIPWFSLGTCAASAGLGAGACALMVPAAAVVLLYGNRRVGPSPTILVVAAFVALGSWIGALANVVLAPVAVGIGAVLDTPPGQDWWPRLAGAAAGCLPIGAIAALAALGVVSQVVTAYQPPSLSPAGLGSLALTFALSASQLVLLFSPIVAPAALGGALLAGLLFSPSPDAPASAPALLGEE